MRRTPETIRLASVVGVGSLLLLLLSHGVVLGQAKLQAVQVVQPQVFLLELTQTVAYGTHLDNQKNEFALYLYNTLPKLSWKRKQVSEGPVTGIEVYRWRRSSPTTAVVFRLREPSLYRLENLPSGIRVSFRPARGDSGKSIRHVEVPLYRPPAPERELEQLQEKLARGRLISLDVFDAEIGNVLRMLGRQSGVNIVAGSNVTGKITVSLHNVTLDEALDNILKANGYTYVIDGDVIRVKKVDDLGLGEMVTKVYRLRYIDARALREAIAEVTSKNAKVMVFSTRFRSEARPAAGIAQKKVKTTAQPGLTTTGGRSSVLIVTDLVENIRHVDKIVEALDVPPPQVMIEAKLIELTPGETGKLGIDWTKAITVGLYGEQQLPSGAIQSYGARTNLPYGKISYATLTASEFAAVLNFLRENTNSKLISNPRIIAADNEESVISVGETFPVPQINRGVGGQGDIVTFQYKDVNISLRVTPHVSGDRTITMFVNPVIEEVTGEVVIDRNRAPITSKRSVQTVVTVKDGETIVIGGLIKENKVETVSKIWLLGDIPLIGNLFRNKKIERKQTDLLIFLTPHILSTW